MAPVDRSHRFNMMLSDSEMEMLRDLADVRGLSAADVLRQLLRDAHKAETGDSERVWRKATPKRK